MGSGSKIRNPLQDIERGTKKAIGSVSNAVNQGLSSTGNSINRDLGKAIGVQGIKIPNLGNVFGGGGASFDEEPKKIKPLTPSEQLRKRQNEIIEGFEKDKDKYKSGFLDIASKSARKQLAEDMLQNKRKSYSEGIFRAGLLDLANSTAKAETASTLAQKEYDINKSIDDQIAEMKQSYTQAGLDFANLKQGQQVEAFKGALERMQQQSAALRDILASGGELAGNIYANKDKKNN